MATDQVLESKLPPVKVRRRETTIELGTAVQLHASQGTIRSVGITPLPGNHQQIDVNYYVHKDAQFTSRTPDPYIPVLVDGKAPQGGTIQGYVPIKPAIRR